MFSSLPSDATEFQFWSWSQIAPYYDDLAARPLTAATLDAWMRDWTRVQELIEESFWRLYASMALDTRDEAAALRYESFVADTQPHIQAADQRLKEKLLQSALEPPDFAVPLRNMRAESALFRSENLALLSEEKMLGAAFQKIIGDQSVEWEGKPTTLIELRPAMMSPDRATRQRAFELASQRRLQDHEALFAIWQKLLSLRRQLAANAGLPDYRAYRWQQMLRFDYTPDDCLRFHEAIEQVVVPAASRIYARRKAALGVDTLRPFDANWDLYVDPLSRPLLKPFETPAELTAAVGSIFRQLDPALSAHFDLMQRTHSLDLDNRVGKGPGAWCTNFAAAKQPFIFMNAVGTHDDVMTLIHEAGHAFHWCESYARPYFAQRGLDFIPIEFMEVASMSMEYLTAPYLDTFYAPADLARARIEHLEYGLLFWPYMAIVDGWQHWAYTHPDQAADLALCGAQWRALTARFMPDIDWSGDEAALSMGWLLKGHIFEVPFYYVEYGLAQLGAVQIWRNSLSDPSAAVQQYRHALSLGITRPLPDLYAAAGAKFAFDAATLRDAVDLMQSTIDALATPG